MAPHPLKHREAPSITLPNQDGQETTIKPGSTGTPMVIFFYPASGVCRFGASSNVINLSSRRHLWLYQGSVRLQRRGERYICIIDTLILDSLYEIFPLAEVDVFKRSNVAVFGISGDVVAKQKSFVDQHGLPYPVLSDSNGEARKVYQIKKGLLGFSEGMMAKHHLLE